MKFLPDAELKNLAIAPGAQQYLAFDELAHRVRDNPSDWCQQEEPWVWSAVDCTRAPTLREMEWAFLQWSRRLNDCNHELEWQQEARIAELEHDLDQDPGSLEIKYYNAVGEELRRER